MERKYINPFKEGDEVVCIDGFGTRIIKDARYMVQGIRDTECGTKVDGAWWRTNRFQMVNPAPVRVPAYEAPESLNVGDKVFIVYRDVLFVHSMERFIGDGKQYSVVEVSETGSYLLSNDYYYLPSSLRLAIEAPQPGKAKKKKKKVKRIPKVNVRVLMRKHVTDGKTTGPCALGWEFKDNRYVLSEHMACHAALGYTEPKKKVRTLIYALSHETLKQLPTDKKTVGQHKRYVKYVISQSPWAECFLTKDVATAFRYDILMDVSKPRNWIAGACITLREGSEFWGKLSLFTHLLDKGHNPHSAFLISRYFSIMEDGEINCTGMSGGHMSTIHSMNFEQLIKFFNEGYSRHADQEPFAVNHSNYVVFASIADLNGRSFGEWIGNHVTRQVKGEGWRAVASYSLADVEKAATQLDQLFTTKEIKK